MSSQDNAEAVDKEAVFDSVNKLYVVYNSYIRNKLEDLPSRVSLERFREIFHELWKKQSRHCEGIYNILVKLIKNSSLEEIEELNESFGMKEKLKAISEITAEYSNSDNNDVKWRPNGNVEETLLSHDVGEILKRKMLLEKLVNDELKEIEDIKTNLDKNCVKINEAYEKIEVDIKVNEQKLAEEIKCHEEFSAFLRRLEDKST